MSCKRSRDFRVGVSPRQPSSKAKTNSATLENAANLRWSAEFPCWGMVMPVFYRLWWLQVVPQGISKGNTQWNAKKISKTLLFTYGFSSNFALQKVNFWLVRSRESHAHVSDVHAFSMSRNSLIARSPNPGRLSSQELYARWPRSTDWLFEANFSLRDVTITTLYLRKSPHRR